MTAVPMHPEATADPRAVRWVVPPGTLPLVGAVVEAPGDLGTLLRTGEVAAVEVETGAVLVRLAGGRTWRDAGPRVRDALTAALEQPDRWRPARPVTTDQVLRAALQDVLDGPAGDYIRSHGGEIGIASVHDNRAEVRMTGTCADCPAAGVTLRTRLEAELRTRFPDLAGLTAVEEPDRAARPTWLRLRPRGT